VKTASQGANLLLNIGPQPDGSLPAAALERLSAMGEWLKVYGPTIYGTTAYTSAPSTEDVAYTLKGDTLYVHIFNLSSPTLELPIPQKVKSAETFASGSKLKFKQKGGVVTLWLGEPTDCDDYVVQLKLSK
jgi:alpha-L-fucosidase